VVARAEEGETSKPAAAETPEEEPIWVKREREAKEKEGEPGELPYGVYLLFSSFVVIAVVRSPSPQRSRLALCKCHSARARCGPSRVS